MGIFENLEDSFREADRRRRQTEAEFEKLACEPCLKEAKEGDKVLVAAGVMGRGHHWMRLEAEVLRVADTAYYVRYVKYTNYKGEVVEEWVHRFAVTDVC